MTAASVFADVVIRVISNDMPNYVFKQSEDDPLKLEVFHESMAEEERRTVSLVNAWNNFQRTGDMALVATFVKGIKESLTRTKDEFISDHSQLSTLVPVIRPERFSIKKFEDKEVTLMHEPLAEGIEKIYAFDGEQMIHFTLEQLLPEEVRGEVAKQRAKQNLIDRGWVNYRMKEALPYGTIYFFDNDRNPFNAQFVIPEMYERHLGTSFYITFPAYDTCVALKMHTYIHNSVRDRKSALAAFAAPTYTLYRTLKSPLVPFMYYVENGKIERVVFDKK